MKKNLFRVMVAEDDDADLALLKHAFSSVGPRVELIIAHNGREALDALRSTAGDWPDLILLDLNMPYVDGRQFLEEARQREGCMVPIVVLTTSDAEADLVAAHRLGANAFVTKPFELDAFEEAIKLIAAFWLRIATPPPGHARRS